jgi:hypothetical protein
MWHAASLYKVEKKPISTVKRRLGSLRRQPVNLGIKKNTEEFRINLGVAHVMLQNIESAIGCSTSRVSNKAIPMWFSSSSSRVAFVALSVVLRARGARLRGDFFESNHKGRALSRRGRALRADGK